MPGCPVMSVLVQTRRCAVNWQGYSELPDDSPAVSSGGEAGGVRGASPLGLLVLSVDFENEAGGSLRFPPDHERSEPLNLNGRGVRLLCF